MKERDPRRGKQRTREHVIADLGIHHVEGFVLRAGHTAQRIVHDYGLDLLIYTFGADGCLENGEIYMQVKASEHVPIRAGAESFSWRLAAADLRHWLNEPMPVILVVYDAVSDRGYWLNVQRYFEKRRAELRHVGKTITVQVPVDQLLDSAALAKFAGFRNDALEVSQGGKRHEDQGEVQ